MRGFCFNLDIPLLRLMEILYTYSFGYSGAGTSLMLLTVSRQTFKVQTNCCAFFSVCERWKPRPLLDQND